MFAQRLDAMLAGICKHFGIEVPALDPLWLDDMFDLAEEERQRGRDNH